MIAFTKSEIDDIGFISKVQILANEIIKDLSPKEVYLFKVDNWFDTKWLNFTGKILGTLGTWHYGDDSRIPPCRFADHFSLKSSLSNPMLRIIAMGSDV